MSSNQTLRLLMPQWQGGNHHAYPLGARLLEWLAPKGNSPTVEVPVKPCKAPSPLRENGIVEQNALLAQLQECEKIIQHHKPKKIVVFGGDCMVEQAPISYLNQLYDGNLGVLWMDAHPDVTTPKEFHHEHAMVLGNLLGEGDPVFAAKVPVKLNPNKVMFGGLQKTTEQETEVIQRLGMRHASPADLAHDSSAILDWIKEEKITKLFIHIDLDVLDASLFRSLLFADPTKDPSAFYHFPQGEMNLSQLARIVQDTALVTNIVGLGITEHMPWDAIHLQNMLKDFPLLSD
ncbi:arginase family protein [Commensalibacter communis]|uniref:arginase family protein n=1 Tax=Commensalibacter communis TaxID=2972786 RepID=UPI0022FF8033|nr:arginase family protein [Commensalibacter communis]CAI3945619.1 Arginase/agmatinase family enzyme (SpeB) (PDB:1CEV) [Commensalibacter communis]CAI3945796.1 Arginase/agmatinase family enzyme (SpeB) (PDB:1CEV) [Commensalibacter communis]